MNIIAMPHVCMNTKDEAPLVDKAGIPHPSHPTLVTTEFFMFLWKV